MAVASTKSVYWGGFRDSAPFIIVVLPFALVFGVLAAEAGLNLPQVMGFSVVVIAGAAQLTALQLMSENAPTIVILASALAVNLRMAMYSASLAPHLGPASLWKRAFVSYLLVDQSFALASLKYEAEPEMTLSLKLAYFFGVISPILPVWYGFTYVGAVLGSEIPADFGIELAVPITFIALIGPALRTVAHVIAALVSVVTVLLLSWVPFNLDLIIAGLLGMMAGARVELLLEDKQ